MKARGWQVQTVEAQTRGFDLISLNARTEATRSNAKGLSDNQRRFIEVKGRAHRGPISLSANEYSAENVSERTTGSMLSLTARIA